MALGLAEEVHLLQKETEPEARRRGRLAGRVETVLRRAERLERLALLTHLGEHGEAAEQDRTGPLRGRADGHGVFQQPEGLFELAQVDAERSFEFGRTGRVEQRGLRLPERRQEEGRWMARADHGIDQGVEDLVCRIPVERPGIRLVFDDRRERYPGFSSQPLRSPAEAQALADKIPREIGQVVAGHEILRKAERFYPSVAGIRRPTILSVNAGHRWTATKHRLGDAARRFADADHRRAGAIDHFADARRRFVRADHRFGESPDDSADARYRFAPPVDRRDGPFSARYEPVRGHYEPVDGHNEAVSGRYEAVRGHKRPVSEHNEGVSER